MSQADDMPNHDALAERFWDYLHGRLDAEAAAKLEQHLLADAQAAAVCKDLVETIVLVQEAFQNEGAAINELMHLTGPDLLKELARREQLATPQLVVLSSDTLSVKTKPAKPQHNADPLTFKQLASAGTYLLSHYKTQAVAVGAIAAIFVLAVMLIPNLLGPSANPIANSNTPTELIEPEALTQSTARGSAVATITATHNAVWSSASAGEALASPVVFTPGPKLHPNQRLTLTAGFAEITTNRGAIAILEAPATIELLDSDNAMRLHNGRLVGLCHTASSKGFIVHTKHADITDLGTEFAVEVMPSGVDTTVFVGSVTLNTPDGATQPITTNQTARLTVQDGKRMIAFEDKPAAGFARRMPRAALITDAAINLDGFRVEVVPNGVYEDVKLFTDRDHELNGVDAAGLPSFLLGADLVMMPADARSDRELDEDRNILRLEIETSQPSDIYILVRSRVVDGDWLTQHYQPTGLRVGQDYVGRSGEVVKGDNPDYPKGIGPGNSLESELEVWKRKRPIEGRQFVGGPMKTGMYAVLAVPAEINRP